jgi:hypothetical protein
MTLSFYIFDEAAEQQSSSCSSSSSNVGFCFDGGFTLEVSRYSNNASVSPRPTALMNEQ